MRLTLSVFVILGLLALPLVLPAGPADEALAGDDGPQLLAQADVGQANLDDDEELEQEGENDDGDEDDGDVEDDDEDDGDDDDGDEDADEDGDDEEVTLDQVPEAVRAAILAELGDMDIEEIEREREDGLVIYEVEASGPAGEVELEIAEDGTILDREFRPADDDDGDDGDDDEDDDDDDNGDDPDDEMDDD